MASYAMLDDFDNALTRTFSGQRVRMYGDFNEGGEPRVGKITGFFEGNPMIEYADSRKRLLQSDEKRWLLPWYHSVSRQEELRASSSPKESIA